MQSIQDKPAFTLNGFLVLFLSIGFMVMLFIMSKPLLVLAVFGFIVIVTGFTVIGPNESKVLTFFGKYIGTIKDSGFLWAVPFSTGRTIPLKIINFVTDKLKVNDLRGNPIEVGAVVVWRVKDAAQAAFNVDDYKEFVANQSDSVVRSIAAKYPYDSEDQASLRGHADEITLQLVKELQDKLAIAGIEVEEVKLAHLAYASEIASSMLKRQQAVAVLEARKYLVENALSIVDSVMAHLSGKGIKNITDDKKAEVINNLLVTLTSDKEVSPVINVSK